MKRIFSNVSLGAIALAVPALSASEALAATTCTTQSGTVVTIQDPSTCQFETAGGCTTQCTPVNFTATCSAMCTDSPVTTCTDTCETKCTTACTTTPATFSCQDYCSTDCEAGCMSNCSGGDCGTECSANCDAQCTQQCQEHPGSTDCSTECQDCCNGSCTVQANIMCDVGCVDMLNGGCNTQCSQPTGGLFCDGQFIDIGAVTDCNFSITVTSTGSLSTNCSAAPGSDSPFGVPAGLAAVAGLGLAVARRRRRG
jgi:MYXO-CTERM domain-containing protein